MEQQRRLQAAAGVLTGLAGLATSHAVVWLFDAQNPPVAAVAAAVRDLTPGDAAHFLIGIVGKADKPLLLGGTTLILLALSARIGILAAASRVKADLAYLVLAALGFAAVLRLQDSSPVSTLGVAVGLATWLGVSRYLDNAIVAGQPIPTMSDGSPAADQPAGPGRRTFLLRTLAVAGLSALVATPTWFRQRSAAQVEAARSLLRLDVTPGTAPAGADLGGGIQPWRTPTAEFYRIDTAFSPPRITPTEWRLRIHGMVEREIEVTYAELAERELTESWITIGCVSNEVGGDLIGNAWWSGVAIRDLLAEAGVDPKADAILQTSADGWNCATPLAALTDDRPAMLALAMNGQPLTVEHGFPVRTIVPGLFGFVSATKWVTDFEVTRFDEVEAYWTQRGWSEQGPVLTQSRIDVPGQGDSIPSGKVRIGGTAWAQQTGIARVEIQVDGGSWQTCTLGAVPGNDTWVQWIAEVDLEPGRHQVQVRATDKSGYTQTSVRTDVIPSGATGWDGVEFTTT